ncbi:MAG: hypothetical protein LC104_14090 [Bacteroidales bacterium]|nr:hypothetical protein [Bacteroidales bacterium]
MNPTPSPAPTATEADDALYPGGCRCFAYKFAFNVWAILFLGVICAGLLNYLGTYAKKFYPGL